MKFIKWTILGLFGLLAIMTFRKEMKILTNEVRKSHSKEDIFSDVNNAYVKEATDWIN